MAKLVTSVGQIFLTHARDENFTSLYEEAFSKHGQNYELFAVVEIERAAHDIQKTRKPEYERLVQNIVSAFKRTYISAPIVDDETFEKALAAINATVAGVASKNKVTWYGRFNAAIGVVAGNQFSLSVTGNGIVYLTRAGEFNLLSENLAETAVRGAKVFTNYSTGSLLNGDRLILSTKQLFNYLSLNRLRDFLGQDSLNESCQEIIRSLDDIKTIGFATFIVEIYSSAKGFPAASGESLLPASAPGLKRSKMTYAPAGTVWHYTLSSLKFLGHILISFLGLLSSVLSNLFRRRSKKYLFAAIVAVLIVLIANIAITSIRKSSSEKQKQETSALSQVLAKLDDAEAAMIYGDDKKTSLLLTEAENLLSGISSRYSPDERKALDERLVTLKNKINKEAKVDTPTVLTQFPNIPTDLLHSPNGFLGFNRASGSMAFYDFRLGETKTVLASENTSNLLMGTYVGGAQGFLFLDRQGRFQELDLQNGKLIGGDTSTTSKAVIDPSQSEIVFLAVLGEGTGARIYLVDTKQNQIWRLRVNEEGVGNAEKWLKDEADLANVKTLAVDGSIYLQFSKTVERYFNGQKQNFEMSQVVPGLESLAKIFTKSDYQFLYLLESAKNRILIYNKNGKLDKQLTSAKFKDAADLYVDEKSRIIYLLAGSELLQVNF